MYESIFFHPRKLKYPTQKSAWVDNCKVSCSAFDSSCSMLSKMRGIRYPFIGKNINLASSCSETQPTAQTDPF